jgi:hypothetical protein
VEDREQIKRRRWLGVDLVAVILAIGFASVILLIMIATIVQILHNERPEVSLSENATQILTSAVGGLSGLLGGYIGYSLRDKRSPDDHGPDDKMAGE